jgi:hypothetical protein
LPGGETRHDHDLGQPGGVQVGQHDVEHGPRTRDRQQGFGQVFGQRRQAPPGACGEREPDHQSSTSPSP